jgi:hypothetical protein
MNMILTITQDDIDSGVCCHGKKCAAALAFARAFPNSRIYVYLGHTEVLDGYTVHVYRHSKELNSFIQQFDLKKPVSPGEYEYEIKN